MRKDREDLPLGRTKCPKCEREQNYSPYRLNLGLGHICICGFAFNPRPKPSDRTSENPNEEAHALLLKCIDRLELTENRLAHGEIEQTLANIYALRISLDRVVECLSAKEINS